MRTLLLLLFAALVATACGGSDIADDITPSSQDLSQADPETVRLLAEQLAAQAGGEELSTVYSALDLVGFDEVAESGEFTFFAPNDSAFSELDADRLAAILADPAELRALLENHVLDSTVPAGDLEPGRLTSVGGLPLDISVDGGTPTVDGVEIVRSDLMVDGGVVHVIDGVLGDSE